MNHQSYLDPPLAGLASHREIYFLARKTLLQWPLIGPILPKLNVIAVNQERADMSALKAVIKVVRAGHCALIFPEGSRTVDGHLERAQPGLGFRHGKDIGTCRADAHLQRAQSISPAMVRRDFLPRSPSSWGTDHAL
jgi:1-acyl-sn-glycerol-3-phosphate acyltransferase